jgi:uncharacterized protein YciI
VPYFFYGRDLPGTGKLRRQTMERHWSFIDSYAEQLIARGPTLSAPDGEMTGSMHLVDLPDSQAAHVFAFREPFFEAGVFSEVLVRRWRNELGGTMWDFRGSGGPRFMVIGHGHPDADGIGVEQLDYLRANAQPSLIVHGPTFSEQNDWTGSVTLLELPDMSTAEQLINESPAAMAGLYQQVELHHWRFGGRGQPGL